MSQGQPDQNKSLVPLFPNQILTTEEYTANQRKIAQIRQLAATMEQSNDQAHQRYIQQELQRRVEEGERARLVVFLLAALDDCPVLYLASGRCS
jgi:tRNA U54 and U55 pseudouridine synthase Pus10